MEADLEWEVVVVADVVEEEEEGDLGMGGTPVVLWGEIWVRFVGMAGRVWDWIWDWDWVDGVGGGGGECNGWGFGLWIGYGGDVAFLDAKDFG